MKVLFPSLQTSVLAARCDKPGIQGLVLPVCGPTMLNPDSFAGIVKLVADGVFTFVLGFSTENLVPFRVTVPLISFAQSVFVDQRSIFQSVCSVFGGFPNSLDHSSVVLIVREDGMAVARQITFGPQWSKPWGLDYPVCPFCTVRNGVLPRPITRPGQCKVEQPVIRYKCTPCDRYFCVEKPPSVQSVGVDGLRFIFSMPFPPPVLVARLGVGDG